MAFGFILMEHFTIQKFKEMILALAKAGKNTKNAVGLKPESAFDL
jgi:hypothetical protein